MSELSIVFGLSLLAGAAMPLGALFAKFDFRSPAILGTEWRHFIVAFGGGALISAIALVLVPEGTKEVTLLPAIVCFSAGGVCFCLLDIVLSRCKNSMSQMVAMLSDFIPEAMALGAAFALGKSTGLLIALLIVLQNIPEGFNAFEEISSSSKTPPNKIILVFSLLAFVGPASALTGFYFLSDFEMLMGIIMLFASGGILYLVFEDVAPQARLKNHWMPALGAVFGFVLGLAGRMMVSA